VFKPFLVLPLHAITSETPPLPSLPVRRLQRLIRAERDGYPARCVRLYLTRLPTAYYLGLEARQLFPEQNGLGTWFLVLPVLGVFWLRGSNIGQKCRLLREPGSNSSAVPSPIDSGCRVDTSTYRLYAHTALHTDALTFETPPYRCPDNAPCRSSFQY
jgi:hypothetical protein